MLSAIGSLPLFVPLTFFFTSSLVGPSLQLTVPYSVRIIRFRRNGSVSYETDPQSPNQRGFRNQRAMLFAGFSFRVISVEIFVNTFELLELRAFEALAVGVYACPVYCVGPLIVESKEEEEEKHECLR